MNSIDELVPHAPPLTGESQEEIMSKRDWLGSLRALHATLEDPGSRSRWSLEWGIHRWANEALVSAAIRIGNSEGLAGPPPARWRLLVHIDDASLGFALVILGGRAPLAPANVVAALVDDGGGRVLFGARGAGLHRELGAKLRGNQDMAGLLDALEDPLAAQPRANDLPDELALALALFRAERQPQLVVAG